MMYTKIAAELLKSDAPILLLINMYLQIQIQLIM